MTQLSNHPRDRSAYSDPADGGMDAAGAVARASLASSAGLSAKPPVWPTALRLERKSTTVPPYDSVEPIVDRESRHPE